MIFWKICLCKNFLFAPSINPDSFTIVLHLHEHTVIAVDALSVWPFRVPNLLCYVQSTVYPFPISFASWSTETIICEKVMLEESIHLKSYLNLWAQCTSYQCQRCQPPTLWALIQTQCALIIIVLILRVTEDNALLMGPWLCKVTSLPLTGQLGLHPIQTRQILKEVVAAQMSSIKPGVWQILFRMVYVRTWQLHSPGQLLFSVETWRKRVVRRK